MTFGEMISKARKAKFISRDCAASELGITRLQLNELEQDRLDPNHDNLLLKLSEFLGLPIAELKSAAQRHKIAKAQRAQESTGILSEMVAFRVSREKE